MRVGCCFLLLVACGSEPETRTVETPPPAAGETAPAAGGKRLDIPADAPLVVFLGDSISAGLHLAEDEAFPAVVQRELFAQGLKFRLVNAGNSGETTAGGLRRIDWLLRQKPAVVVVELGGNDGLRGQPVAKVRANLAAILDRLRASGAKALLLGMRIPTSYGEEYTEAFAKVYDELAEQRKLAYVPFFMEPIAGEAKYFLEDALHPNRAGHELLAKKVVPALAELLR